MNKILISKRYLINDKMTSGYYSKANINLLYYLFKKKVCNDKIKKGILVGDAKQAVVA